VNNISDIYIFCTSNTRSLKNSGKGNCKLLFGIHIIKHEWRDDNMSRVHSGATKFLQNHFIASCSVFV